MTPDIQSMLLGDLFEPNCRIKVRGEHFFTDKRLYTNMYGIAFFTNGSFSNNPHISPACEKLPGILDDYFDGDFADLPHPKGEFAIRDAITAGIPKKYLVTPEKKKNPTAVIECSYLGRILREPGDYIVLSYGAVIPTTLCITDDNTIFSGLPFSPFPTISFLKGSRVFQSIDFPVPTEPFSPPERITIDFAVSVKNMKIDLSPELFGKIILEYSLEVGVTKCEVSKIVFEISPIKDRKDIG